MIEMTILNNRVEWRLNGHIIENWHPDCPCELTADNIKQRDAMVRQQWAYMISDHRQSGVVV